ncbi:MAG: LapA family protein [Candidatus Marinimicrobia bacterium]|nr:LapA family protein [Candidatus Neomarinimicrobiota bacterium]MBL7046623.1 LapA family protein [Candidatus Neomarinimicrobiota bacterium]
MRLFKTLFGLAIVLILVLILLNNAEPVSINLLFTHYETVSLAVVIVVTLAVGIIIGFTIALTSILLSKNEARNLKSENRKLIEEVNNLRNIAIDEGIYELNEGEE